MDRQPSQEMAHVKKLFEGRSWHDLVPDQDHSVVTAGFGTFDKDHRTPGGDYVAAARTADGSLVMAYVPSAGSKPRTITVDMARLSGPATARWYNPTNATYTAINESPIGNRGSREFTTRGDNGTGTNDRVLALETTNSPPRSVEGNGPPAGAPGAKEKGNGSRPAQAAPRLGISGDRSGGVEQ